MWKRIRLTTLLFLLAGLGVMVARAQIDMPPLETLTFDEVERGYRLYVPTTLDTASPVALVIALHGGGGDSEGMVKLTDFNEIAEREGFLVVYPEGAEGNWNDGREPEAISVRRRLNYDDVGFITALIDHLETQYPIDPARIFATGISNGGAVSFRLACELSGTIRAIATVSAGMPATLDCQPTQALSILMIHGTDDPLVPWEGVDSRRGELIPTLEAIRFWQEFLTCAAEPTVTPLADAAPNDGTTASLLDYPGCAEAAQLQLIRIEGGGHTWPGGPQYLPRVIIGLTSRDFVASEVIWAFFAAQG